MRAIDTVKRRRFLLIRWVFIYQRNNKYELLLYVVLSTSILYTLAHNKWTNDVHTNGATNNNNNKKRSYLKIDLKARRSNDKVHLFLSHSFQFDLILKQYTFELVQSVRQIQFFQSIDCFSFISSVRIYSGTWIGRTPPKCNVGFAIILIRMLVHLKRLPIMCWAIRMV